jgi:hypothetical protein
MKMAAAVKRLASLDPSRNWPGFAQEVMDDLSRDDAFYYSTMILVCGNKPY